MSLNERAVRALSLIPSVFFRLVVSYIVLVFLVAAMVSGVSYLYFKIVYNEELEAFHGLYLKNIDKELSSQVVDASKLIYMELDAMLSQRSADLFSPEDRVPGQASKIYSSYRVLNDLVSRHYDILDAVHLYYVESGLLISSTGFRTESSNVMGGDGKEWLRILRERGERSAWTIYRRPEYLGIYAMTLFRSFHCFPILSSPEDCSVVVSVDFRADAISGIMARLSQVDGGLTAVMAPGREDLIGSRPGLAWDEETGAAIRQAIPASIGDGQAGLFSRDVKLRGGRSLLTFEPLSDSGWYVVNVVKASQLYKRAEGIRLVLLAICLVVIGIGALAAIFAASGIYNPLSRLLGRFGTLFGLPLPEPTFRTDEYRVIDDALSGISSRMDELRATVGANKPIITHELIARLIDGERIEAEEIRGTFELLGTGELPRRFRAAILSIDASGSAGEGEGGRVLKYRVAGELGQEPGAFILASPLSGDRIGLVAESGGEEEERARSEGWIARIRDRTGARARIASGSLVSSPEELTDSFAVALELSEYFFLFPELSILVERPELLARSGRSAFPEKDFPDSVAASLRSRDTAKLRSLLEGYRARAREGECQVRACRSELERLGAIVVDFARELRLPANPRLDRSLGELLAEARSIDAFMGELVGVAADICAKAEDPQQQRNALLVARIKAYVAENLGGDLSLDGVGEAVAVSPGYMGKIFKEETGRNFVSYLTEVRLIEAGRLLVETREPIQEIGRRVGFNTPAYFIRLFKGHSGQTPLDYRRTKAGSPGRR